MADYQAISLEVDRHGVARLTLDRAEARNAMSQRMIQDLCAAAQELAEDERVRVVVLTGAGDHFAPAAT